MTSHQTTAYGKPDDKPSLNYPSRADIRQGGDQGDQPGRGEVHEIGIPEESYPLWQGSFLAARGVCEVGDADLFPLGQGTPVDGFLCEANAKTF